MCVYIKKYERERELNKDCHDLISSIIDKVSRCSKNFVVRLWEKGKIECS